MKRLKRKSINKSIIMMQYEQSNFYVILWRSKGKEWCSNWSFNTGFLSSIKNGSKAIAFYENTKVQPTTLSKWTCDKRFLLSVLQVLIFQQDLRVLSNKLLFFFLFPRCSLIYRNIVLHKSRKIDVQLCL